MLSKLTSESAGKWYAALGALGFAACLAILAGSSLLSSRSVATIDTCKDELVKRLEKAGISDPLKTSGNDQAGEMRLVGVWPERVSLGERLCVAVAGVASDERARAPQVELQRRRDEYNASFATYQRESGELASLEREALKAENELKTLQGSNPTGAPAQIEAAKKTAADRSKSLDVGRTQVKTLEVNLKQAAAALDTARVAAERGAEPVKVTLFLDNVRAETLAIEARSTSDVQYLIFDLTPEFDASSGAAKFWRNALSGATKGDPGHPWSDRYKLATVGLSRQAGDSPTTVAAKPVQIVIYTMWLVTLGAASAALLFVAVFVLARTTTLLRDNPEQDSITRDPAKLAPYSLARVQMAMWGALVFFGFIFIWLTLGQVSNILNPSTLLLLGITAATGLMAIQSNDKGDATSVTSGSFFKDIFYDGDGPTIHRIQMAAWTVILAVVFVWNVLARFVFVEFDPNLLVMTGFVSGTYLGFKQVEKPLPLKSEEKPPPAL